MKNQTKVLVAHPLQQHSYQTSIALKNAGLLSWYITSMYYNPKKNIYRLLGFVLKSESKSRMIGKKNHILDNYVHTFSEIIGILYLFIIRIDKNKIIEPKLYSILVFLFNQNLIKFIKRNNPQVVLMYDTTAYSTFRYLSKQKENCIKILDMSSASAPFIRDLLVDELEKRSEFSSSIKRKLKSYTLQKCKRYLKEIELADYFLVPSKFVEDSLKKVGVKSEKILKVPYGVDLERFNYKQRVYEKETLKFLFVGRIEAAKGVYYLLEAFKRLKNEKIELLIAGQIESDNRDLEVYKGVFNHIGSFSRDQMPYVYSKADILILPTLWEGFSLTVYEAMAMGMPVIATKNSGAEEVITNGSNGYLIEPFSVESIINAVKWFIDNRNLLDDMSIRAYNQSLSNNWGRYHSDIVSNITKVIKKRDENEN